jgi:hypothetical protein
MSYLSPPRLTFSGQSYANASTANNNDVADVYDIDTMTFKPSISVLPGGTSIHPPPPGGNSTTWKGPADNPQLRQWLMGLVQCEGLDAPSSSMGYAQMAHWNYYGDHGMEFRDAYVTNCVTSAGQAPSDDPLNKAQVQLLGNVFYQMRRGGVLVDVDPYALNTSQVFAGRFQVSFNLSENQSIPIITADNPTVAYSYFINANKNLNPSATGFEPVSAVFQFGLPLQGISFYSGSDFTSQAFSELKARAAAGKGLVVRYCLYDAIFKIGAEDLYSQYAAGNYVSNPYEGRVLGTIGVWDQGELASAPPGRKLRVQIPYTYTQPPPDLNPTETAVKANRMSSVAKYRKPTRAENAATKQASLGVTLAVVDAANQVVSLDCISTFPEASTVTREKYDLGVVNLVLLYGIPPAGGLPPEMVVIGSIPNNKTTYEAGGGIVEISYASHPKLAVIEANIATGRLAINFASTGKTHLIETPGTDTQTDTRAVYFDAAVGQAPNPTPGTAQIPIQVYRRGVRVAEPTTLNLEYWMCQKDLINPDKTQVPVANPYYSVAGATTISPTRYTLPYLGGQTVSVMTQRVQIPAGGQLTLTLTALRPGVSSVRFVDPTPTPGIDPIVILPTAPNFAWDNCDYAVVRILPFDDYSVYTDQQINNWSFIYDNFFGFYSVLYPIMSTVIPWGPDGAPNDPNAVKQFANQMLSMTSPDMWYSTIYMPITRDLSGGKRELLRRWCNLQL